MDELREKLDTIHSTISTKIDKEENFKMVFSKPRISQPIYLSIHCQPVRIKDKILIKCVLKRQTQDETINIIVDEILEKMNEWLTNDFLNLDVFLPDGSLHLLQNKKGSVTLLKKNIKSQMSDDLSHDRVKKIFVNPEGIYYRELGLISGAGNLFSKGQKKYNQVNKYIEMVSHLLKDEVPKKKFNIADMGSGKAYLTFAMYDFLTNTLGWDVTLKGYETRGELVETCNQIAQKMKFDGLSFHNCSIENAPHEKVDMVIALHACDIATDMAIEYGITCQADYIVLAPCCQKQIRQNMEVNNVLSPIMKNGILLERQAEILTDGLRSLLMQYKGYQTKIFEFVTLEHTSKNVMITAVKSKPNLKALEEFNSIKKDFGINYHYLEKLLNLNI